jgi:EAL domain-containing protein (putative c-di-GMP-specific phosphodiesterase class I)
MAVNVSNRQFKEKDFIDTVKNVLADTNLDPHYLELEVTESCIMEDVKHNLEILHELKAFGVKLSIDDFGTGYSSFEYLKNMPVNVLKIDISFIRDITKNTENAAIVKAIIQVAHTLKLEVVAEGVETKEQLNLLQTLHCDKIQGYLVSKPLPQSAEIERFMKEAWHLPDNRLHDENQGQSNIVS